MGKEEEICSVQFLITTKTTNVWNKLYIQIVLYDWKTVLIEQYRCTSSTVQIWRRSKLVIMTRFCASGPLWHLGHWPSELIKINFTYKTWTDYC